MGKSKLNKPFARGVRWKNGAWRYRVPYWLDAATRQRVFGGRAEITLGRDQAEAAARYSEIMRELDTGPAQLRTIGDLIERYTAEVLPLKAPATQRNRLISIERLRPVFAHVPIEDFLSSDAYTYRDLMRDRPTSANHDIEVLSHLFSMAIQWGAIRNEQHPIRGLRIKFATSGSQRYVEDWEIQEAGRVASPMLRAFVDLVMVLGLRPGDMLRLGPQNAQDDGIHVTHTKTGKPTIYRWTDERHAAWQQALDARPKQINSLRYLFHTKRGEPYIKADGTFSGFSSIWKRWQQRALEQTALEQTFTAADLRAKVASDSEDLEQARRRLGHTTTTTTRRHYHRRPEIAD